MSGPLGSPDVEPADGDEQFRVLLLLDHERNRELLAERLDDDYDVVTADGDRAPDVAFDLAIVDPRGFRAHRPFLEARKETAEPLVLPYLLVTPRDPGDVDRSVWQRVDDVVTAPVDVRELRGRVSSLLRQRRLSLRLSERRQLSEIAHVISHDLRNPLNVAQGHLDRALRGEAGKDTLETVSESLDRMETLIEDVRAFARHGYVDRDLEPVALSGVAGEAWRNAATGDATFVNDCPEDRAVLADETRLLELFENLFRNADVHNEGSVTVRVGALNDGFVVEDDGTGIPPEERERVFETSYSTRQDGTGLGLAIVGRVVETHGWTVEVTESAEGGARFEVTGVTWADPGDEAAE